jgi:hypothetical protein
MRGVITNRDILANLGVVWREFGALCALRCVLVLVSGRRTTFLDVAMRK